MYESYPEGFAVTAKIRPDLSTKGSGTAFASNGTGNFGVVSNVTSSGFYGSFVNSNGRMQLGTYQNAKGLQFDSLLTDNTGKIFKKQIDEPYTIRLEVDNDVLYSTINGIECNKSGTTTFEVPEAAITRSETSGSYGILTEFATSYELYSFKVESLETGKAAIKMTTSETDSIATLKENATAYVFLNNCAYTTRIGADAITFNVSATSDDGIDVTTDITIENSVDSIATAEIADESSDGTRTITITPAAVGTDVITVYSGELSRTITVTVEEASTYTDTDYNLATALYPVNEATDVYEDDHLVLTFDDTPVLNSGNVEIYDSNGNIIDKLSVDGSDSNTITDGSTSQLYQLKYFMVQVVDNTVEIIPNFNKLENGQTYHVGIPENVITGTINGKTFTGFDPEKGRWTFSIRDSKPTASSAITVGKSDSADFRTVQGALQAVNQDTTITVEKGTYREILFYTKSYNLKIVGDTTTEYGTDVVIQGINCNSFNSASDTRCAFHFKSSADLTLENITIQNAYDRNTMGGTAQSEALYFNSTGHFAAYNSSFLGHQDTLLTKGKNWLYKCYIEGDTDFIWGYADACLLEECKIVQLDTSSDTEKTSASYVFETRVGSDSASTTTVGKGYVLFNTELVSNHPESYIGRRANASVDSGKNYYDQFAAINVNVSSGSVNGIYGGSNSAVYIEADDDGNQNVGAKVYGGTGISADSNVNGSGTINETIFNAEYSGRAVILNKVFKKTGKYINDSNIWDYTSLETEFGATTDSSSLDAEEEVDGADGTYDICSLAEQATGNTSYSQNDVLTDGTSSDGYLSWKNLLWHSGSSNYGVVTNKTSGSESEITIKVAGASVISWTGSSYSNGTVTVTDSNGNTIVDEVSTKESTDKTSQGFIYTGTTETTLTISFNAASTYINNIVVSQLDDEEDVVASIVLDKETASITISETTTLTPTVTAAYLSTDTSVIWSSSNTDVATVDDNGVVTGIAEGTATITATSTATPSKSASCTLSVTAEATVYQTYSWDFYKATSGTQFESSQSSSAIISAYSDSELTTESTMKVNTGYGIFGGDTYLKIPVSGASTVIVYVTYQNSGSQTLEMLNGSDSLGKLTTVANSGDINKSIDGIPYAWNCTDTTATSLTLSLPSNVYVGRIYVDNVALPTADNYTFTFDSNSVVSAEPYCLEADSSTISNLCFWTDDKTNNGNGTYVKYASGIYANSIAGNLYLTIPVSGSGTLEITMSYASGSVILYDTGINELTSATASISSQISLAYTGDAGIVHVAIPKGNGISAIDFTKSN